MRILMVGVDQSTQGGMWTVVENYLKNAEFCKKTNLKYIPTSITGSFIKKISFTFISYIKIFFELSRKKYDVVHIHVSERGSIYRKYIVLLMARLWKCKTIFHMHGAEFEVWYRSCSDKKKKYIRKIVNKADRILILGEYWKDFLCSLVEQPEKIQVLYNAVEVPEKNKYRIEARKLLFLGVVGKRKGMDDLLAAMKNIDDKLDEDIKLYIYGPDFSYGIEQRIKKSGLENRVDYKGWLEKEEKEKVMDEIAINILPSYNEGLPMTILETMARGIPNITTSIAAIPEAVSKENGILLKPGDVQGLQQAILTLMDSEKIRQEKSDKSFEIIKEKFSLERHIHEVLHIYNELERSI